MTKMLSQTVHLRTKTQVLLLVVLENQTNELARIAILNYNLEAFKGNINESKKSER